MNYNPSACEPNRISFGSYNPFDLEGNTELWNNFMAKNSESNISDDPSESKVIIESSDSKVSQVHFYIFTATKHIGRKYSINKLNLYKSSGIP